MTESQPSNLSKHLNWAIAALAAVAAGLLIFTLVKGSGAQTEQTPSTNDKASLGSPAEPGPAGIPTVWTDQPLGPLTLPVIRVDKSDRVLTVFDGDTPVKSYRVATGKVVGDKQVEGDRRTPEGEFYVCLKQGRGQTVYTRALGLSYPNAEDARRGLDAGLITRSEYDRICYAIDRAQQPPWNTALGGEILIHGKKKGRDDTLGCVALEDAQIRELFDRIETGTRVVIQP